MLPMFTVPQFKPKLRIGSYASGSNTVNGATHTFNSVDFGAADPTRRIVVAVGTGFNGAPTRITSATIGGITATVLSQTTSAWNEPQWIVAEVPTGTSGAIVVNTAGTINRCPIGVWSVLGGDFTIEFQYGIARTDTNDWFHCPCTCPPGGVVLAATLLQALDTCTWTNLTEDDDFQIEASWSFSTASGAFDDLQSGLDIICDWAGNDTVGSYVTFAPPGYTHPIPYKIGRSEISQIANNTSFNLVRIPEGAKTSDLVTVMMGCKAYDPEQNVIFPLPFSNSTPTQHFFVPIATQNQVYTGAYGCQLNAAYLTEDVEDVYIQGIGAVASGNMAVIIDVWRNCELGKSAGYAEYVRNSSGAPSFSSIQSRHQRFLAHRFWWVDDDLCGANVFNFDSTQPTGTCAFHAYQDVGSSGAGGTLFSVSETDWNKSYGDRSASQISDGGFISDSGIGYGIGYVAPNIPYKKPARITAYDEGGSFVVQDTGLEGEYDPYTSQGHIEFVGSSTADQQSTITLNYPTGTQKDDFLILVRGSDVFTANTTHYYYPPTDPNPASKWQLITYAKLENNQTGGWDAYCKFVDSPIETSVTIPHRTQVGNTATILLAFRNVDRNNPLSCEPVATGVTSFGVTANSIFENMVITRARGSSKWNHQVDFAWIDDKLLSDVVVAPSGAEWSVSVNTGVAEAGGTMVAAGHNDPHGEDNQSQRSFYNLGTSDYWITGNITLRRKTVQNGVRVNAPTPILRLTDYGWSDNDSATYTHDSLLFDGIGTDIGEPYGRGCFLGPDFPGRTILIVPTIATSLTTTAVTLYEGKSTLDRTGTYHQCTQIGGPTTASMEPTIWACKPSGQWGVIDVALSGTATSQGLMIYALDSEDGTATVIDTNFANGAGVSLPTWNPRYGCGIVFGRNQGNGGISWSTPSPSWFDLEYNPGAENVGTWGCQKWFYLDEADVGLGNVSVSDTGGTNTVHATVISFSPNTDIIDLDALAVINAYSSTPNTQTAMWIQNLINDLKDEAQWRYLKGLYILAANSAADAIINWKSPGTYDLNIQGTPTFQQWAGFDTNSDGHFLTGYTLTANDQNDFHIGAYLSINNDTGTFSVLYATDTGGSANGLYLVPNNSSTQISSRMNQTTNDVVASPGDTGMFAMERANTTHYYVAHNGSVVTTHAHTSTGVDEEQLTFMADAGGSDQLNGRIGVAYFGTSGHSAGSMNTLLSFWLRKWGAL